MLKRKDIGTLDYAKSLIAGFKNDVNKLSFDLILNPKKQKIESNHGCTEIEVTTEDKYITGIETTESNNQCDVVEITADKQHIEEMEPIDLTMPKKKMILFHKCQMDLMVFAVV